MMLVLLLFAWVGLGPTVINCQNITLSKVDEDCLRCICHAASGCHVLQNCAKYSMDITYWRRGGRNTVSPEDISNETLAYNNCVQNENCILTTIYNYTSRTGDVDCNCDGRFDCDDRFPIHYNNCYNTQAIWFFKYKRGLYENCMNRSMIVSAECVPEDV